jgi:HNH endonuclease
MTRVPRSIAAGDAGSLSHIVFSVPSMKRCAECGREFMPSSRHLRCPACRSKGICACGRPKQAKSHSCRACRKVMAQAANGNWKGGRTRHKAGYVMVRAPDHPRAGRSPYVFEHVLVAEQLLGRYLPPGESIHHRNGVRDDNRPENLELRTKPQPSGIWVSDAIAWARELLERYGEVERGTPPKMLGATQALLEVPGFEPGSSVSSAGLLRAQPVSKVSGRRRSPADAASPAPL